MKNRTSRLKSSKKIRSKIILSDKHRLTVYKTAMHTYAQIFSPNGEVIVSASTLEKKIFNNKIHKGNIETAKIIGKLIAERAKEKNIIEIAFDRSGFIYHGRVKALAESARENGLKF